MRILKWLLSIALVVVLLPPLLVLGYGLYHGLDLGSMFAAMRYEPPEFTIDAAELSRAPYADAVFTGKIEHRELEEASGLAPSRREAGLYFALNDSGNDPALFAFGLDGRHRGRFTLPVRNVDFEDLASFEWQGRPYLVVADVGDNFSWRPRVALHVVEEPTVGAADRDADRALEVAWTIELAFEGGPRDCEAIAVDPEGPSVLLLGKRMVPPTLHRVDLSPPADDAGELRTAVRIGAVPNIPQPTLWDEDEDPEFGEYRSFTTALDTAPDGALAVILTYKDAYYFPRIPGESWAEAFARVPALVPLPPFQQAEAASLAADGRTLVVTSEQHPAPIFRLDPLLR